MYEIEVELLVRVREKWQSGRAVEDASGAKDAKK
jgi:hypothetical protein